MPRTIADHLEPHAVSVETLNDRYEALAKRARLMFGAAPKVDRMSELYPPGLRAQHLLAPCSINSPAMKLGRGLPRHLTGLALFAASQAAGCAHSTAFSCSLALRQGATQAALMGDGAPRERAVTRFARALGMAPHTAGAAEIAAVRAHFSDAEIEEIILAVAMAGFLNKHRDAIGAPLEDRTLRDVIGVLPHTGWRPGKHASPRRARADDAATPAKETLRQRIAALALSPELIFTKRRWTQAVPASWPAVGGYLKTVTGHDFPVLAEMRAKPAIRALATALRDNLDPNTSVTGLRAKTLGGLVLAERLENKALAEEAWTLARLADPAIKPFTRAVVTAVAQGPMPQDVSTLGAAVSGLSDATGIKAIDIDPILLARGVADSPSTLEGPVQDALASRMAPGAVAELLAWLAIVQYMHRLRTGLKLLRR